MTKKNNMRMGRHGAKSFPMLSTKLRTAALTMTNDLFFERSRSFKHPSIEFYINAKLGFHFAKSHFWTKKGKINLKLPDLSNLYQLVEDCLQSSGIIRNDHFIASHDGSYRAPSEDETNYVLITLSRK